MIRFFLLAVFLIFTNDILAEYIPEALKEIKNNDSFADKPTTSTVSAVVPDTKNIVHPNVGKITSRATCGRYYSSCSTFRRCCSGFSCQLGRCRYACRTSGYCRIGSSISKCCSGYNCVNSRCIKAIVSPTCRTSGYCNRYSSSYKCCSGYNCVNSRCVKPCAKIFQSCRTMRDCCQASLPFFCMGGICQICRGIGQTCSFSMPCCSKLGLFCSRGRCKHPLIN